MSKSRAAPLKKHSLPRLKLMAAVVAARLCSFVKASLNSTATVFLCSDSQIVLSWIFSDKKLKPFVSNRVSEIPYISTTWRYCPSGDNPADLLTRGITFDQLCTSNQWNHGLTWLSTPSEWPTWHRLEVLHVQGVADELDTDHEAVNDTTIPPFGIQCIIDITRFSLLNKLLAVTAYMNRFIHNSRKYSASRQTGPLTVLELTSAKVQWLHHVKHSTFTDEIDNLISKRHRLPLVRQLKLILDHDGLIRCGGRIHNAPLSELAKFPYLLLSHHIFTTLVIKNAHATQLHSGVNATLSAIRQTYWIPSARQRINSVIKKCVTCIKTSGKPYAMPDPHLLYSRE